MYFTSLNFWHRLVRYYCYTAQVSFKVLAQIVARSSFTSPWSEQLPKDTHRQSKSNDSDLAQIYIELSVFFSQPCYSCASLLSTPKDFTPSHLSIMPCIPASGCSVQPIRGIPWRAYPGYTHPELLGNRDQINNLEPTKDGDMALLARIWKLKWVVLGFEHWQFWTFHYGISYENVFFQRIAPKKTWHLLPNMSFLTIIL